MVKDIQWFKCPAGGLASLYHTNITLNKDARVLFEEASYCMVGLEGAKLALRPLDEEEAKIAINEGNAVYKVGLRPSYARISSTGLMAEITLRCGLRFSDKARKFPCHIDKKERLLLVDLLSQISKKEEGV